MFQLDDHLNFEEKVEDQGPPVSFTNMEVKKSQVKSSSNDLNKEKLKKKLEFLKINFDSQDEVERESNQQQIFSYLKSIRISRTDYSIKGNKVVQISERKHQDHNLFNILSKMHDGQIFEYVVKKEGQELPDQENQDENIDQKV